ncbi:MAG: phosphotransferase family protein [Acidobacteria bacterium]|nr:phosphotransferase family protein [Acidobacteriota bacterium]MBK8809381.1 phosphotransferase family protein [Acidobacteriota bacterium]
MTDSDTRPVRAGEELDLTKLREFLASRLDSGSNDLEILQFPSGSSNLTYCVKIGDAEYVLRRPPFGNQVKSAHDMSREFNVLSKLSPVYAPAPKPLVYCDDESVIGSEFYLMERREGLIIRGKSPDFLEDSTDLQYAVCESFINNLAALHAIEYKAIGLGDLGKPEGYVGRQIEGWTRRYFNAKTADQFELETAIEWLETHIPESEGAALVHNDYKFDNVMLNPRNVTEITAVLDWEMATIGEPLMDLGTTLGYWMGREAGPEMLAMPFNPRAMMENITRAELVEMYAVASGRDVSNILYYYVFGTFKIAVIAQQIYFRYSRGFTKDERFSRFNHFVNALGKIAMHAIGRGRI